MTVIIYASCYQQNEGWTPSADPKENLFSDPFRATGITISILLEIRIFFFFFFQCPKILFLFSIDSRIFRFCEIEWILRISFLFYV